MPSDRNNQNFKRIKSALKLTDSQIVEIFSYTECAISKSKAHTWSLGKDAVKIVDGKEVKKMQKMTNFEFDMFCKGLPEFKRKDGNT